MKIKLSFSWTLTVLLFFPPSLSLSEEPEEIWKKLSQFSGRERQNLLLSNARAEGEVVLYTTKNVSDFFPLRKDFEEKFPGVKLRIWRASGERIANRILTEARANKFIADTINVSNEMLPIMKKTNLIGRYRSPERKFYPKLFKDQDGYWTAQSYILAVIAYNTNLVRSSEAPKKYEDFLDPKWKGNFAIDSDADRALMGWLKTWGNERTEKFWRVSLKTM